MRDATDKRTRNIKGAGGRVVKLRGLQDEDEDQNAVYLSIQCREARRATTYKYIQTERATTLGL